MDITIGRIVIYRLSESDAKLANKCSGTSCNPHQAGQELPLIVAIVWPNEFGDGKPGVNGQVFLDGCDTLWVTSVGEGSEPGQWHWPARG